jgi:hypothetical protein
MGVSLPLGLQFLLSLWYFRNEGIRINTFALPGNSRGGTKRIFGHFPAVAETSGHAPEEVEGNAQGNIS